MLERKLKDAATRCDLRPVYIDASKCVCSPGPRCGAYSALSDLLAGFGGGE